MLPILGVVLTKWQACHVGTGTGREPWLASFLNMRNTLDIRTVANRYAAQLQLCCSQRSTSYCIAQTIHAHMIASGFKPRGHILNRLMDIYCKSSNIAYALHLFNKIPEPDIVARTTLIAAYSTTGNLKLAQEVFGGTPLSMRDTFFFFFFGYLLFCFLTTFF